MSDDSQAEDRFALELEQQEARILAGGEATTGDRPDSAATQLQGEAKLTAATDVLRLIHRARSTEQRVGRLAAPSLRRIGRFEVVRLLGEGGFGLVYLARDTKLDRLVAIKIPKPQVLASASTIRRFIREGNAAAALNHPHIVPVFEVGEFEGVAFIAAAYCPGVTLAQWLEQHGRSATPSTAAAIVARLADAIEHAHRRGVVHRDLKPANVLLQQEEAESDDPQGTTTPDRSEQSRSGEQDRSVCLADCVQIIDFGLASLPSPDSTTQTGDVLGTPCYMSPEQLERGSADVGPESDIFALGIILYELLCGRPPFRGATPLATLDAIRSQEPIGPHQIDAAIPRDLEAITLKCLEKSPRHRYPSAAALADDLGRFQAGEPVRARSIHRLERFSRWCCRNPLVAGLAASVVLLAIGATVMSIQLGIAQGKTTRSLADALRAKQQATRSELDAQLAFAEAVQVAGSSGQRERSLVALRRAAELASEVSLPEDRRQRLRNAVIVGLAKSDLVSDRSWSVDIAGDVFLATDPDCELYACVEPDGKDVCLRRLDDGRVERSLAMPNDLARLIGFRFSRDGSRLGARYESRDEKQRMRIWELSDGRTLGDTVISGFGQAADFSPNGSLVVAAQPDNSVDLFRLPSFEKLPKWQLESGAQTLVISADGDTLAIFHDATIELYQVESRERTGAFDCPSYAYAMEFSPDGRFLAAGCRDGKIRFYELPSAPPRSDADRRIPKLGDATTPRMILDGHSAMVVRLAWHPSQPLLASGAMDGKTVLWDLRSQQPLLAVDEKCTNFSRDGRWLGTEGGRLRVQLSHSYRRFAQSDAPVPLPIDLGFYPRGQVTSEIDYWDTLPGSSLVVGQNFFHAVFRDLATDTALADVNVPACWFRFGRRGKYMYAASQVAGFCRLPIAREETPQESILRIGPPESLSPLPAGPFAITGQRLLLTPYLQPTQVLNLRSGEKQAALGSHPYTFWCDLSPDGRLAATGTMKSSGVRIFDTETGQRVRTLPAGTAAPWFSPDGSLLVVAESGRFTFYGTEDWQPVHQVQSIAGGIWPSSIAFSADGQIIALEMGSRIELIDSESFTPLASFQVAENELVASIRFSGDGRYLISGGGDQHTTHVWDLDRIRRTLRHLALDWKHDEPLSEFADSQKPIRLQLDLGALTEPWSATAIRTPPSAESLTQPPR